MKTVIALMGGFVVGLAVMAGLASFSNLTYAEETANTPASATYDKR